VPRISWLGLVIAISTTVGCWVSAASSQTATGDVQDDFESGTLSEERWYLRQAVLELIDFDETSPRQGRRSLLIGIDETVRAAQALTDSEAASLRFSLIDPPTLDRRGQPCPPAVEFAESPVQRNEIRVAEQLQPFFGDDLWYGFSIKALGDIPECGGVRWVIGQWKHTTADSPFLAQRFDNGVFHVSVQDDHCRCRVTQAPGDPDRKLVTASDKPLRCVNTDEHSPDEGKPCESALRVYYGDDPMLPDIKLGWVDMLYRVRGGRDGGGFIEIYANSRFVARVTGPIGYKGGDGDRQYFKIGNYRNFIPGEAQLDVDIFWRGEEPPKFDQDFRPEQ
jgi:hypothetical protein